ncbi:hypothetical protein [Herbaspirillum sp. CAH-3]|uniref:hypothetical protein n=1 Tax=Herbaspirillum sp. CAH-3 TaxID=2605746 RepID=UPI0012ACD479|nr:hypothetical protein [Herbaspirillum sp. CAH-3]MRT27628.1 hypothetical protein [Herbaspirillum sp. CAH-3]
MSVLSSVINLPTRYAPVPAMPVAKLRHVGTHCRYPNVLGAVREWFGFSVHYAPVDIPWFLLGWTNYWGYNETANTGSLQITTGLEYPLNRDDLQIVEYRGAHVGTGVGGADIFSDGMRPDTVIRAGTWYGLWHFHANPNAGIPFNYGGPQPWANNAANGLSIITGTVGNVINHLMFTATAVERRALVNTDATSNQHITPMCILTDSDVRSFGLLTDSRGAGMASASPYNFDYVSDASLLQCAAERVFGPLGPWMNLGAVSDGAGNFIGGYGGRRHNFLRFVTDVFNGYGTNDFSGAADSASLIALDAKVKSLSNIRGKKFWGGTIPPRTTSTDESTTLANQTVTAADQRRRDLNAYRLSQPAIYDGGVLDFASVVEDPVTHVWKANGIQTTGAINSGSNVFTATAAVFLPAHTGKTIYIAGAGASAAALVARMVYVSPTIVNLVNAITGAAVNAGTSVAAATTYVNCREWSADRIHETQFACQQYAAQLGPAAAAMAAATA